MGGGLTKSWYDELTEQIIKKIIGKYQLILHMALALPRDILFISIVDHSAIALGYQHQRYEVSFRCDNTEEIIIILNEILEILKPTPKRIRIDLGKYHIEEAFFNQSTKSKHVTSHPFWVKYVNRFQNLRGIITDKTYFSWDHHSTEMQKIEGRRYLHVLDIKDLTTWIQYRKMSTKQKAKCNHYYKDLFEVSQEELDHVIFSISLSSAKNDIKKMLFIITFELPFVIALKYEGIIDIRIKYHDKTHHFVLLFMFVTWGLDPNSDSIFKWFLLGHKLYDPRLLIFIANFIDEDLPIPVYENLRLDEVNGLNMRRALAVSWSP